MYVYSLRNFIIFTNSLYYEYICNICYYIFLILFIYVIYFHFHYNQGKTADIKVNRKMNITKEMLKFFYGNTINGDIIN